MSSASRGIGITYLSFVVRNVPVIPYKSVMAVRVSSLHMIMLLFLREMTGNLSKDSQKCYKATFSAS